MSAMASQITSLMIVYSTVYSGADKKTHQSSVSLAFVQGIHRWPHITSTFISPIEYKSRNRHQNLWVGQYVSSWWPQVWLRTWIVLFYVINIQMLNWWRKGCPMAFYSFWTKVVLCRTLVIITNYEMIDCRHASTAYMICHKLVLSNVHILMYLRFKHLRGMPLF